MTNNASTRTQKVIRNKCAFYNIPIIDSIDTFDLQTIIGENVVAIGINNYEMAQKVLKEMRCLYVDETSQKREQENN